jgi:penicillin-insensitive murein DD-endopeptidase
VGCVSAEAGGEKCGQGALAAGLGKAMTHATNGWVSKFDEGYGRVALGTAIAAMTGGVAAEIGGGKFTNGATTAAMGYLFNCVAHKCWMLPNNPEASYYRYGTPGNGAGQYAQAGALNVIFEVEIAWGAIDSRSIGIGNISLEGGGPFPPHGTHQQGLEFDVRPLRTDGAQAPVTWRDAAYDRAATQRLVDTLRATGQVDRILFNDPNIKGVTPYKGHDNHLHVKVKPPG